VLDLIIDFYLFYGNMRRNEAAIRPKHVVQLTSFITDQLVF